jgi:parallel beta-helix repeat protein
VISGNTITGNRAESRGGGIYCGGSSSAVITNNTITMNQVLGDLGMGGGINFYALYSTVIIEHNTIVENSAYRGGGLSCEYDGTAGVRHNTIADNTADNDGGGVYSVESTVTMAWNAVMNNDAGRHGGGIACRRGPDLVLINNLVTENTAAQSGGGIYCEEVPSLTLRNATLAGNSSAGGGGIYCTEGSWMTVSNTILWGDTAATGIEIYLGSSADPSSGEIRYSDVDGGLPLVYFETGCSLAYGAGMITADPRFAAGPAGDYYLSQPVAHAMGFSSPCINAGDPSSPMIFGATRPDGLPDLGIVDMGYHYPTNRTYPPDLLLGDID